MSCLKGTGTLAFTCQQTEVLHVIRHLPNASLFQHVPRSAPVRGCHHRPAQMSDERLQHAAKKQKKRQVL